jgi:putative PIN family toxin of toxin-antitoxin system
VRRVTIDTNIFVSAFEFGGKPAALLQMAMDGEINVAISQAIIDETVRILRDKFKWDAAGIEYVKGILARYTQLVVPGEMLDVVPSDADDNRIAECAVASGSEAIVTGDKDLLRLKEYAGIKMVTVRDFLQRGQSKA